jgi:hypothetical protein
VVSLIPGFVSSGSLLGSSYEVCLHCQRVSGISNVHSNAFSNLLFSMEEGSAAGTRDPGREQSSPLWGFQVDGVRQLVAQQTH